jgi:probable rRNA maturation factor
MEALEVEALARLGVADPYAGADLVTAPSPSSA